MIWKKCKSFVEVAGHCPRTLKVGGATAPSAPAVPTPMSAAPGLPHQIDDPSGERNMSQMHGAF